MCYSGVKWRSNDSIASAGGHIFNDDDAPARPLSPPIVNPNRHHSYLLLDTATWRDSEAEAVALGGHLATIRNQAEEDWIVRTFGTCGGPLQVNYPTPPASSGCGTIVSVVCEPPSGSFFPLGTNTVQCTAIDSAGNAVTCSFTVTVVLAITPLCAPVLTINLSGTSVVISWPDTTVGFSLEFNDSFSSPLGWTPLNGPGDPPVTDTNGTYQIILPLNHDSRYYRLRY